MKDNPRKQPRCERIETGSRINKIKRSRAVTLKESEERFRAIFDSVNDAIFIHDLETGDIVDVNQRMCEMYGFPREEALRLRATDSSSGEPPYTEQDALNWLRKAATGEPQLFEWHAKHKTGRLFWVEVNINRATIGGKERLVVTVRDITGRKKAEIALRESDRRYTGLFEALRDGFVSVYMDGRIAETNPFYRSMVGYAEEELNGMTYVELTPEKWHGFEENIVQEQVLKRGYSEVYEKEYIRKDGTVFPIEIRTHLLRDENGEPLRMWGFVRDITHRKQAQETLQEYERAIEGSEDMIVTVDRDYRYRLANAAFLRYRGMSKEQIIGRSATEILGNDVFEKIVKGNLDKCFRGEVVHYEMKHTYPELGERELLVSYLPINGPHGIDRITTLIRDVTEQRHAEAALKQSEERYRGMFENSPLGIFQSTFEGKFIRVNPALARILGYESPQDVIDSISDMATQIYANPQERSETLQRMRENGGQIICENEYLRKDGRKWVGHLTLSIINDENGNPHHLDGIVEDVTEKKTMEERLQYTMEQLRTLSHRLLEIQETERRYIARELHDEIGQALTALRIDIKRAERSKTLESALTSLYESSPIVEELINQVRNLSIELRPSILDDFGLTAALDWYVNWLSAKAGFKVMFHTDFTEERFPPILELTCFRITQEALTNAARHSNAKNVYVDLETISEELHLTVRDDGKGFDIDKTHKRALEGKSFGLLGMQERASLAGGHLEITSRPGKGTVVHAYFPQVED